MKSVKVLINFIYIGCSEKGRDAVSLSLNFSCFLPTVRIVLYWSALSYFLTDLYH